MTSPAAYQPEPRRLVAGAIPQVRRVELTTESELLVLEPPEWVIDEVLPGEGVASIFGASGTYKSFIALYMAMCIAMGRPFHGRNVRRGAVIYVAAEGFFGMQARYRAGREYFNVQNNMAMGLFFLRHSIEVKNGSRDIRELIEAIEYETDERIGAIFLDTLNRNLRGNENAPDDMADYVRGCEELKVATGATVISIHHTGHTESERSRGHSSWYGALDTEIKCERDRDRVTIKCSKQKDGPEFLPLHFDMVKVGPSLVPKECGTADVKMTPARATALQILPQEGGLTRKAWETASGLKPGTFRHVLDWCVSMAYVRQARDGKYSRNEAGTQAVVPQCQSVAT